MVVTFISTFGSRDTIMAMVMLLTDPAKPLLMPSSLNMEGMHTLMTQNPGLPVDMVSQSHTTIMINILFEVPRVVSSVCLFEI